MIVYVFGNPVVPEDSQAVNFLPYLKTKFPKINFVHADPTGNWWEGDKNLIIIDTVEGIDDVIVFTSLEKIEPTQSLTVHDYDLYMDLKLMKKLRKITTFKIIGVPVHLKTDAVKDIILKLEEDVKSKVP